MKILKFPGPKVFDEIQNPSKSSYPEPESELEEVSLFISGNEIASVLFVDKEPLCSEYVAEAKWLDELTALVEVDTEICRAFKITQVPLLLFFWNGEEIGHIVGKADEATVRYWHQVYSFPRFITKRGKS